MRVLARPDRGLVAPALAHELRAVSGAVISAKFGDCFYVKEAVAPWGIKVTPATPLAVGAKVDVTGSLQGAGSERSIDTSGGSVSLTDAGPFALNPAVLTNASLGGAALNALTPGVTSGMGPNTIGAYVSVCGRASYVDSATFIVFDGSGPEVTVTCPNGSAPADGAYVAAEGISSFGPGMTRGMQVWDSSCVVTLVGP